MPIATRFPISPAHNPISRVNSSSSLANASQTPRGVGFSSNLAGRLRERASSRGRRWRRTSRGEVADVFAVGLVNKEVGRFGPRIGSAGKTIGDVG